jgi:protein tyrosine/serine phosphatase
MQTELDWKSLRSFAGAILVLLAFTVISQAQEVSNQKSSAVKIRNFGQMDERFYRGARPKPEEFKGLAALGIKTVIDLTEDPNQEERAAVESLGMKYIKIPMIEKKYPTEEATNSFLKVANDPATGKFFVHCAGGRHRTGAMGAVYRYQNYDWTFDQVYAEMKQYDFYTSWGHGAFKEFVKDYYDHKQAAKLAAAQLTPSAEGVFVQTQDKR